MLKEKEVQLVNLEEPGLLGPLELLERGVNKALLGHQEKQVSKDKLGNQANLGSRVLRVYQAKEAKLVHQDLQDK